MAFFGKLGNILRQTASKKISAELSASSPSFFQAIRCMSSSKLFIGGLSYSTDDTSLREAFNAYGEVIEARVIVDRETGRSRGFGFVTFTSGEEASSAIQALDGQDLHGRRVRVNYATDRARTGGFGGGGFGGGAYGGGGGYGGGGYGGGGGGYGGGGYGGGGDSYGSGGGYGGGDGGNFSSGGGGYGVARDEGTGGDNYASGGAGGSSTVGGGGFDGGAGGLGYGGGGSQFDSNETSNMNNLGSAFEEDFKDDLKDDDDEPDDFANKRS